MQNYTHKTLLGDVAYTLQRRSNGGAWHYRFYWKGVPFRKSSDTADLPTARTVAARAIEAAQNAQNAALIAPTESTQAKALKDLFGVFMFQKWPDVSTHNSLNAAYTDMRIKGRAWFNRLIRLPQSMNIGQPLDTPENRAKYPHPEKGKAWPSYGAQLATMTAANTQDEMRDALQAFVNEYKVLATGVTVHNQLRAAHRFIAWLILNRHVSYMVNPASVKFIDLPTKQHTTKDAPKPEDVEAAVVTLRADPLLPVIVLMCSGYRPKECSRATWSELELPEAGKGKKQPQGKAHVNGKGERDRDIPLSPWAVEMLREYKQRVGVKDGTQRVWTFAHNTIFQHMRARLKGALTAGDCRRYTAWKLWDSAVTAQKAADIMGNSVEVIQAYYRKFGTTNCEAAAEALNHGFGRKQA